MPKTRREIVREVREFLDARPHRSIELLIGLTVQSQITSPLVESTPGGSSHHARAAIERLPPLVRPEGTLRVRAVGIFEPRRRLLSFPAPPGRWSVSLAVDAADTTAPAAYWLGEARRALAAGGEWREALQKRGISTRRVDHLRLAGGIS